MTTDHKDHSATLHIFVNRRKFGTQNGVKPSMTGAEIASLVGISADQATVRWETGPSHDQEILAGASVNVKNGDHFLATRNHVEGG